MTKGAPPRLLFVCTGNSARSQMGEGFARALGGGRVRVQSAGIEAHGLNPRAIAVMAEAGVDIAGQESTVVSDAMLADSDLVITVCGDADERCPLLPPGVRRLHWPLPDPAKATGSEDEITAAFRGVRDDIRARVDALLQTELGGLS
ncbi:MAG: arsenate reductase ArsC [Rhodovibrio sp.]|nr:arsenate reductase ArsC [Rhodovibrio sp.]